MQFCGVHLHLKEPFLVFEFVEGKDLDEALFGKYDRGKIVISQENQFQIALDVAKGMAYLHSGGGGAVNGEDDDPIIHRDLKPENIMACVLSIFISFSSPPLNLFPQRERDIINIMFLFLFFLCSLCWKYHCTNRSPLQRSHFEPRFVILGWLLLSNLSPLR